MPGLAFHRKARNADDGGLLLARMACIDSAEDGCSLEFVLAYEQAELPDNFNNRFYARSSAISHSEPFVVLEPPRSDPYWKIQPRPEEWERWAGLSQTMSLLFTIHMIGVVSRTLGLGLDSEVAKLSAEVDAIAKAEMKPVIERLSK